MADAKANRVHGTLVEVASVGVLVFGRSGIGKSECALELVMRGHRLVADDVVLIDVDADDRLIGTSPELVRHYMELRGIGIVHVPSVFGPNSVVDAATIDLVVQLWEWGSGDVDRTGLDRRTTQLVGFEIDALYLPVAPGRNVASLVEVAARNHLLRKRGRSGAADLETRVAATLRDGSS